MISKLAYTNGQGQPKWRKALRRVAKWGYSLRWKALPPDYNRAYRLTSNGFGITVLPSVFHPKWHFTSEFFARVCAALIPGHDDCSVLEVGTGTGLVALSAARRASKVVAIDINPAAVKCAKINAVNNRMAGKVEVYEGDMFGPVAGRKFELILCNPPYFRGTPRSEADLAYMGGPNLEWISRLASEARSYLAENGSLVCIFSDAADVPALVALVEGKGWTGRVVAKRASLIEELTIWQFKVKS